MYKVFRKRLQGCQCNSSPYDWFAKGVIRVLLPSLSFERRIRTTLTLLSFSQLFFASFITPETFSCFHRRQLFS